MIKVFRHHMPRFSVLLALGEAALFTALIMIAMSSKIPDHWIGLHLAPLDLFNTATFTGSVVLMATLAMGATGLYNRDVMFEMDAVLARLALAFSMAFVAFSCLDLLLSFVAPGRSVDYKAAAIALPVCALLSLLLRTTLGSFAKREGLKRRVLVVGRGASAAKIARMARLDRYRFKVVGYLDLEDEADRFALDPILPRTAMETPEAALALVKEIGIEGIVIAGDHASLPKEALLQCRTRGINVEDFPAFWERHAGHIDLDALDANWFIYGDGFSMSRDRQFVKTCFDYFVASLLLLVTAPITLLTALLIKVTSPGPVFFRQERVGRNGKTFNVLKFRSMAVDAEKSGPQWAKANDARVTPIGRFIRKVRIDEIPQVINILKGDMSFVGPRPERPHFVQQLSAQIPYFDERHRVKPGLSGWAQINYPYGASVEDARNKLSYDLYYLKNGTIFLDFVILVRTVQVVLWPDGAR